jgi:hypothetical protein
MRGLRDLVNLVSVGALARVHSILVSPDMIFCARMWCLQGPSLLIKAVTKVISNFDFHFIDGHEQARRHHDWLQLRS